MEIKDDRDGVEKSGWGREGAEDVRGMKGPFGIIDTVPLKFCYATA